MTEQYGRRKDDIMVELPPEMVAKLTDSQKINIQVVQNLTSINTALNDTQHEVVEMRKVLDIHDKLLVTGNGDPSIQERIRNLENFVSTMKYWGRLVGGAIVIQTIAFFVGIVIALVRFLPILEQLANKP